MLPLWLYSSIFTNTIYSMHTHSTLLYKVHDMEIHATAVISNQGYSWLPGGPWKDYKYTNMILWQIGVMLIMYI